MPARAVSHKVSETIDIKMSFTHLAGSFLSKSKSFWNEKQTKEKQRKTDKKEDKKPKQVRSTGFKVRVLKRGLFGLNI